MAGKPIVVTAHESLTTFDIDGSRSASRRRQKLFLKSLYMRYTTLFVLTSELEARHSLPPWVRQRTVHCPVVDGEGAVPVVRPRGEGPGLRVGFLARIDPKKNLDLLIDAMAQLPDHVRLVIAGDGPADLAKSLRRRADRLGVSDRLEWLGFVEPGDRTRLLENLDLLAMPSAFESFGLSAAEAMLHGVPVLVSDRTGIAEVIGRHGGGRITEAAVPAIATAISELDADRGALGGMGACGQMAVREELNYARIGQSLYDAYTDALGSPTQ
jgi:glycosyltransferase involved in cell wall biosynthesis